MNTTRAMYESIMVFTFFQLICGYLAYDQAVGYQRERIYQTMILYKEVKHIWPLTCFCKPIKVYNRTHARRLFSYIRLGVNQFAILNPLLCVTQIQFFRYTTLDSNIQNYMSYGCLTILWISCWIALYTLGMMLMTFLSGLRHHNPIKKFLTIKIVLFLDTFQSFVQGLTPLATISAIDPDLNSQKRELLSYVEATLVSLEMFLLSILIWTTFNIGDFNNGWQSMRRDNLFKRLGGLAIETFIDPMGEITNNQRGTDFFDSKNGNKNEKPLLEEKDSVMESKRFTKKVSQFFTHNLINQDQKNSHAGSYKRYIDPCNINYLDVHVQVNAQFLISGQNTSTESHEVTDHFKIMMDKNDHRDEMVHDNDQTDAFTDTVLADKDGSVRQTGSIFTNRENPIYLGTDQRTDTKRRANSDLLLSNVPEGVEYSNDYGKISCGSLNHNVEIEEEKNIRLSDYLQNNQISEPGIDIARIAGRRQTICESVDGNVEN